MQDEAFIPTNEFCAYYHIESSFVDQLKEYGLIEISIIGQQPFINREQLRDLEKFIHLHYDLNINMEGIDAIRHLLNRMQSMEEEMVALKNRLRLYE